MGIPLCFIHCFPLAAFNICSLYLIFVNLINTCLGVFCLGFILFGTLWVSLTFVAIFFRILGKCSTIISSSIFMAFLFVFGVDASGVDVRLLFGAGSGVGLEERGHRWLCRNENSGAGSLQLPPTCNDCSLERFECTLLGCELLSAPQNMVVFLSSSQTVHARRLMLWVGLVGWGWSLGQLLLVRLSIVEERDPKKLERPLF